MNDLGAEGRHTYLFTLVDGGGTVPPELAAVRRLVERGHRVEVLAEDSMRSEVMATGASFVPWTAAPNRATRRPEDDPYRDWECRSPFTLFRRLLDRQLVGPAPAYAADVTAAITRRRPDLVVSSFFALGAMAGAEAEGVPFDVLFPNIYLLPAPGLPPMGLGLKPASGGVGRLRDRLIGAFTRRLWDQGLPRLNALRSDLGLEPVTDLFDQLRRARCHLLLTSPDFDFPAELPSQARYVGPVLDDPAWAADHDWILPPGDAPLVLVGLSSTFQDHAATLQRVIDALAALPVRGIVTTGPAIDPATLSAPPSVVVVASAPHSEILPHAAAVVTHGGHGTVVRSLAAGVPMLVVPHGRDQADNAVRVTERGAGLALKRSTSGADMGRALTRLLEEPAFRAAATDLGESIRRDAANDALVQALEAVPAGCLTRPAS